MQKERLIQGHTTSAINQITAVYNKAEKDIKNEVKRVFSAYKTSGKLTDEEALTLLNGAEKSELIEYLKQNLNTISDEKIRSEILNRINAIAYSARITRLEALQERVDAVFRQMADDELGTDKYVLANAYKESYYRTIFDCQQGFGIGADFALIPEKALQTVLESKFKGKNFSKRIWINTNVLANKLKTVLGAGIASGASIEKMSNDIADLSLKGKIAATRLIRTETTFYMGQGELKAYSELGIDKYKYLATLDSRTSPMCAELDGKVFNVADAAAGVNYPPLHPWCRSTTVAYFEDGKGTRIARDKDGGTYKVPSDMTYREWKEKYVDERGLGANDEYDIVPKHNKPKLLKKIDISDENVILSELKNYEDAIAAEKIENAVVITKDGEVWQCFGIANRVFPDSDLGDKLYGAYVTHSHPIEETAYSFSDDDYDLFEYYKLPMLRGVDLEYIYEFNRSGIVIDDANDIADEMTFEDFNHWRNINQAKEKGIGYQRWKNDQGTSK